MLNHLTQIYYFKIDGNTHMAQMDGFTIEIKNNLMWFLLLNRKALFTNCTMI